MYFYQIRNIVNGTEKFQAYYCYCCLAYANGGVHIGHHAGVYVPADIYMSVTFVLETGCKVYHNGSDEHGVPITIPRQKGCTPQDVVDRYHKMIKDSFHDFGISFDIYSRTTSDTQTKVASDFFKKLYDDGKLIENQQTIL